MRGDPTFVDTNVLFYAHDDDAGEKHDRARARLEDLWGGRAFPIISVQVLQEFYVNLIRKSIAPAEARATVENYLAWHVVDNDRELLKDGMIEQERWRISYWDALIVAAAKRGKARFIWSEDFNTGQDYGGITAVNPLRDDT